MKKTTFLTNSVLFAIVISFCFWACLKDSGTRTYKIYRPVIQKTADIRNGIQVENAAAIINPGKMFLLGNNIYLNENGKGIHIIDNTNPANPINKQFIKIPGNYDLAVKGNTLYADCYTDLIVIDISNPAVSKVVSFLPDLFPDKRYVSGFYFDSGYIATNWIEKDTTFNISISEGKGIWRNGGFITPIFMNMMAQSGVSSDSKAGSTGIAGSMSRFAIQNDWLYAVSTFSLNVINIASSNQPVKANKIQLGFNTETIYPFQDKLFIGSQTGMSIYSVSNPSTPSYISGFAHARLCDPVIADDNYAFVTLRSTGNICVGTQNELDVIDISNINSPHLMNTILLTQPHGLSKDGNTLFVCDGNAGLKIFDASTPYFPKLIQTIPLPETFDVISHNGIALVSAKDGLYQFDYSNPAQTKQISKIGLSN